VWRHNPDSPVTHVAEDEARVVLALERGPRPLERERGSSRRLAPPAPRVAVLDRETGRELWAWHPGEDDVRREHGRVAIAHDGAIVLRLDREVVALEQGRERWRRKLESSASVALAQERVVVSSSDDGIHELDLATGQSRWSRPDLRTGSALAIDARGVVYAALVDGRFVGVAPDGSTAVQVVVRGAGPMGAPAIGFDGTAFVAVGRQLVAIR
jgi:outer membrane protein assembly factor BamB